MSRAGHYGPQRATAANPYGLSARELEMVLLLVEGCTYQEIAARMFVSSSCVRAHAQSVRWKMDVVVRGRAGASNGRVLIAVKWVREQELARVKVQMVRELERALLGSWDEIKERAA